MSQEYNYAAELLVAVIYKIIAAHQLRYEISRMTWYKNIQTDVDRFSDLCQKSIFPSLQLISTTTETRSGPNWLSSVIIRLFSQNSSIFNGGDTTCVRAFPQDMANCDCTERQTPRL